LIVWFLGYCVAFFLSQNRLKAYEEDKKKFTEAELFKRWHKRLKNVIGLHGLALNIPLLVANAPTQFFITFWLLTIGVIAAINLAQQAAVLSIFSRFFNFSWNTATAIIFFVFLGNNFFVALAMLLFTFGIYIEALRIHKFLLNQIRLEESSAQTAKELRVARDTAETALQEKNQFLATASHDLRQPVHAMGLLIQAVLQNNKDPALLPALNDLSSSVRTMSSLFNSLLDLSKLESGIKHIDTKSLDLRKSMRETVALFEVEAQQRGLFMRLFLPTQKAWVQADPNLLHQILINLLQNALRYTPKGGILLGLRARQDQWRIEVWDTGIGVAEENRDSIYLPYFRQENAWRIDSAGHGLGLAVVARSAQLMEASYGMDSRLGKGSRFWVNLPKATLPSPGEGADWSLVTSPHTMPVRQLPAINTGQCLIVEDDPQVCEAWKLLMQAWGVHALFASNSVEAFACLEAGYEPQVVLCDERLRAGESGFALLKALLAKLPNAHGAMVSGEFSSPALVQAEEEGYVVLHKPVEMELMHTLLSRWLPADGSSRSWWGSVLPP
jgi:signal transduction histidine kinase/CheY-like chemotaxis protein